MRLVLLVLACACFNGHVLPESVQPFSVAPNSKPIDGVAALMEQDWQRSGFARPEDPILSFPVLLAVAKDGTVCIVTGDVWAIAKRGDFVTCADRWRLRRP